MLEFRELQLTGGYKATVEYNLAAPKPYIGRIFNGSKMVLSCGASNYSRLTGVLETWAEMNAQQQSQH